MVCHPLDMEQLRKSFVEFAVDNCVYSLRSHKDSEEALHSFAAQAIDFGELDFAYQGEVEKAASGANDQQYFNAEKYQSARHFWLTQLSELPALYRCFARFCGEKEQVSGLPFHHRNKKSLKSLVGTMVSFWKLAMAPSYAGYGDLLFAHCQHPCWSKVRQYSLA